jgi:hypothetical protein
MIPDFALQPAEGEFDLAAILGHLDALDTAVRDPQMPERFLLSSYPETLERAVEERKNGQVVPYAVAVLHPGPKMIALTTMTSDSQPSRKFVEWLRQRQPIRILDQEFTDFTDQCHDNLDAVFGEPD